MPQRFLKMATSIVASAISIVSGSVFAADENAGILWQGGSVTASKLREGNITFNDIPPMISGATTFVLGFAATIAMIMIIYGAFQMSLIAVTSDEKKKGYDTMKHGIFGFVIAVSAWLIIKVVISNL